MSLNKSEFLQLLRNPEMLDDRARRRMIDILLAKPARPARMSYEEFLEWAGEDTLAEWVNGEVIMTSPASLTHQVLANFLARLVTAYVEFRQIGRIIIPPFQMKLARSGREPDLIFVARENLPRLKETYLDGPADLVVEIVSPESVGRDRGEKFYEYEQAGIPEYWLIDPQTQRAEFYQLDEQARYRLVPLSEGVYHARQLPGFWLRPEWLWQTPLPQVDDLLLTIVGEAYAQNLIQRLRNKGFLKE